MEEKLLFEFSGNKERERRERERWKFDQIAQNPIIINCFCCFSFTAICRSKKKRTEFFSFRLKLSITFFFLLTKNRCSQKKKKFISDKINVRWTVGSHRKRSIVFSAFSAVSKLECRFCPHWFLFQSKIVTKFSKLKFLSRHQHHHHCQNLAKVLVSRKKNLSSRFTSNR